MGRAAASIVMLLVSTVGISGDSLVFSPPGCLGRVASAASSRVARPKQAAVPGKKTAAAISAVIGWGWAWDPYRLGAVVGWGAIEPAVGYGARWSADPSPEALVSTCV